MYFLQHIKSQFVSQILNYNHHAEAGFGPSENTEDASKAGGETSSESDAERLARLSREAEQLQTRSRHTRNEIAGRSDALEAAENGNDVVAGGPENDVLDSGPSEVTADAGETVGEMQGPVSPDELASARSALGEDASPEAIQTQVADARLVEGISEKYDVDPEFIQAVAESKMFNGEDWTPEERQEKLEDMMREVQKLVPEGEELPTDIDEIIALYEAQTQNDDTPPEEVDADEVAETGVAMIEDENGSMVLDPTAPGMRVVGDTTISDNGFYSRGGQTYRGEQAVNTTPPINLNDEMGDVVQPNPLSPSAGHINSPQNRTLIETRVPERWHLGAVKLANKVGDMDPTKVICIADVQNKKAVVCYPGTNKFHEFPIIIGAGGSGPSVSTGDRRTPTDMVFNFNGGKAVGRGNDASRGGSTTVLGAAAYSPEAGACGGRWWHGVADSRIPGGATHGCIGAKQENMIAMTQAILNHGGGYGINLERGMTA